jgi:hypothetical protein
VTREIWQRSDRIVGRRIGGELVLVPIFARGTDADAIFHLNKTAGFIWEHLDGKKDVDEISRLMAERFEVLPDRAAIECRELLETLRGLGAVACVGDEAQ